MKENEVTGEEVALLQEWQDAVQESNAEIVESSGWFWGWSIPT